jgi:aryl-alcohol dehydrogenase-like predicted oxidoreductase
MNSATALAWLVERCDLDCVLAGGVFNSGILAGPGDDATYDYAPAPPGLLTRARRMRDACASYGIPFPAAALQFTLRHPAVTAAMVGARAAEEIASDVSYLDADTRRAMGRPETGASAPARQGRQRASVPCGPEYR